MLRRFRVRVRFARAGDVMLRVLIMLFILAIPFAAAAEVYKWVDENGVVHYSETPPPDRTTETVEVPEAPGTAPATEAEGVYDAAIAEMGARREQRESLREQEAAERKAREEARTVNERACAEAIHYLATLKKQCPVFYDGAGYLRAACPGTVYRYWEGERTYIDDDERQRLIEHYSGIVERCKAAR